MNPFDGPDDEDPGPDEDFGSDMITMNPPRWQRLRSRPVAVAGVAIAALAAGGGVGYAATHSVAKSSAPAAAAVAAAAAPTPSASAAPTPRSFAGGRWRFPPGGLRGGLGFAIGGPGGVVHGQLTVPKSGGGYETVDVQQGTVSAVSAGSITVKSADGFTASYVVSGKTLVDAQAAGIGSVKKGDTVFVTATVSGTTATAANVTDLTAIKAGRAAFGFPERPKDFPSDFPPSFKAMPPQPPSD